MSIPGSSRLRRFRNATLAIVLLTLAPPALAADFEIDNLRLDFGKFVVRAPKVAVKGSALEREAFVSLFNSATGESATARINRLNAAEISAPELTLEQSMGPQKQVTTYRDIRFSDVRDGKIGSGEAASGTITVEGAATGPMKGDLKRTSFEGFDLRQTVRVMTEKAAPGTEEPALPLFRSFVQEGYALDMGAGGKMTLGRMAGRDFKARVGPEPLAEVMTRIVEQAEADQKALKDPRPREDDPAQRAAEKRMGLSVLTLFDMIDYGSGEMRDLAMTVATPPDAPAGKPQAGKAGTTKPQAGKPQPGKSQAAKPETVDIKIARIGFGEDTPAKSGFAVEGLQFAGGGARGLIDSISYSGFSFASVIRELRAELAKPESDTDSIDFRRFVPTIGTIRLTGISIDAPPILPGHEPIKLALGTFELKAGEQLNGIPTSLALTIDRLVTPVTEGTGNPAARDLIAMGIRSLDLSAKLDLAWAAARNEIDIRSLSLGSAGLIQFDASGSLGNVTKDLFSSDLALAQVAALGATVRKIEAKLQNSGLIEKLIENEARKAKSRPEALRQQYAMMATLGLSAILGPSDAAKTLTAAVSRFVAKPGTLTVEASAKSGSGLGLADVITLSDPTEILDKIDLKATAE